MSRGEDGSTFISSVLGHLLQVHRGVELSKVDPWDVGMSPPAPLMLLLWWTCPCFLPNLYSRKSGKHWCTGPWGGQAWGLPITPLPQGLMGPTHCLAFKTLSAIGSTAVCIWPPLELTLSGVNWLFHRGGNCQETSHSLMPESQSRPKRNHQWVPPVPWTSNTANSISGVDIRGHWGVLTFGIIYSLYLPLILGITWLMLHDPFIRWKS